MKLKRIIVLLVAAGSGALVYHLFHTDPQTGRSNYENLTGQGSLFQTIRHAQTDQEEGYRHNPPRSAGGIGPVGNPYGATPLSQPRRQAPTQR